MSAVVLCVAMAVFGTWVNHRITRSVLAAAGADGAALMKGILEQHIQRIRPDGTLHPEDVAALDRLFVGTTFGESIVSVKLWVTDGSENARIVYSSMAKDTIGERHVSTDVQKAAAGELVSEFEDMVSNESLYEQSLALPLIEIYAPLYRSGTQEVLAVGEIYEDASVLAQQLREGVVMTWIVACVTTILMIAILYLIVLGGSRLILRQQAELGAKVKEAEEMAAQNHALRVVADRSRLDANEANEELLGRIGLDIHDGPIQFLTLLRFRLDEIVLNLSGTGRRIKEAPAEITEIADKLSAIIDELRDLSVGLVLPELGALSLRETIELAVQRHEQLTGTQVQLHCDGIPAEVQDPFKTCIYRIVQESLSNSFKHAGGHGQRVMASTADGLLKLEISDQGPRDGQGGRSRKEGTKLGRRGIQNRVAAFNGHVEIDQHASNGTRVSVAIPLEDYPE